MSNDQAARTAGTRRFHLGYGTNGLADHPLDTALQLIAEQGYSAVALTIGHPHLDPWNADLPTELERLRDHLDRLGLAVVIETGVRFLLDPRCKHHPALVHANADRRMDFMHRSIEIASALGARCVSFFSGVLGEGDSEEDAWQRLEERVRVLVQAAARSGVVLAIEPEPGMVVETVRDALRLRERIGGGDLRITVDIGHCVVVEPHGIRGALLEAGDLLANVQLDDMPDTHHEHLPFGEGDADLTLALATLDEMGFEGIAAVELPRHSHDGPALVAASMLALQDAWQQVPARRRYLRWMADAIGEVSQDPGSVHRIFPGAGRFAGRRPLDPSGDPTGILRGTEDDAARVHLLDHLASVLDPIRQAETLRTLYLRGDSSERRGVLRWFNASTGRGDGALTADLVPTGLELATDALRTNDRGLVAAAAGAFARDHLDQHDWRHAVLKLVFMDIDLRAVAGLELRTDAELARMARDFARERTAAGRPVPPDIHRLIRVPAGVPSGRT
ncbi:EboA domain-containing protein [Arthrobacter sp. L77]|uniref:EboA domain-containing protein n=1 Tax=Arthrobacter sp. L77 TaxID=1496689 RepID=UPI0005B8CE27|nr:EboA domain-containing protein [Arthrobacter sp. L77]